eukprot:gene10332-10489_t
MAAARQARTVDENANVVFRVGKAPAQADIKQGKGNKRRALGDIGNVPAQPEASKQHAVKEKAASRSYLIHPMVADIINPRNLPKPVLQQVVDAPVRLTRSQTRALAQGYVNDVYVWFRKIEPRFRAPANYMDTQVDINEKMRAILIDWLVEVHLKFKLMPESLFLTVNLIDRYLAVRQVTRKNLQLVGVTAMLVAAKYEEIWAPEVRDFVYISDKAYTRKQILDTERDMLQALGYNLSLPTSYQFLARLLKAANVHYEKNLALFVAYCAELCLVDYGALQYSYSELAAGIMYVALKAFQKEDAYPHNMMRHAYLQKDSVLHISKHVVRLVQDAQSSQLQAIVKKYSTAKFCEASMVAPPLHILNE